MQKRTGSILRAMNRIFYLMSVAFLVVALTLGVSVRPVLACSGQLQISDITCTADHRVAIQFILNQVESGWTPETTMYLTLKINGGSPINVTAIETSHTGGAYHYYYYGTVNGTYNVTNAYVTLHKGSQSGQINLHNPGAYSGTNQNCVVPTATPTKTSVPPTATFTKTTVPPTATHTNTAVPPTHTPTNTAVPPTNTPTNTAVPPTFTPTDTLVPPTDTPTDTQVPPTVTPSDTPVPPTFTPTDTLVPPTNTPTDTQVPPTVTPSDTPVPPTNTPNTPVPPTNTPDTPVPPTSTPDTPVPPTSTPDTPVPPTNTPEGPTNTPGSPTGTNVPPPPPHVLLPLTIHFDPYCTADGQMQWTIENPNSSSFVYTSFTVDGVKHGGGSAAPGSSKLITTTLGTHTVTVYYGDGDSVSDTGTLDVCPLPIPNTGGGLLIPVTGADKAQGLSNAFLMGGLAFAGLGLILTALRKLLGL